MLLQASFSVSSRTHGRPAQNSLMFWSIWGALTSVFWVIILVEATWPVTETKPKDTVAICSKAAWKRVYVLLYRYHKVRKFKTENHITAWHWDATGQVMINGWCPLSDQRILFPKVRELFNLFATFVCLTCGAFFRLHASSREHGQTDHWVLYDPAFHRSVTKHNSVSDICKQPFNLMSWFSLHIHC